MTIKQIPFRLVIALSLLAAVMAGACSSYSRAQAQAEPVQFLTGDAAYAVHIAVAHEGFMAGNLSNFQVVVVPDQRGHRVGFVENRPDRQLGEKGGRSDREREVLVGRDGTVIGVFRQE